LTAANRKMMWIPEGFAHGFMALEENTVFQYRVTDTYSKAHERSLAWDDSQLAIAWPAMADTLISEKDQCAPTLGEAELSDYTIANYKVENEPEASERCRRAVLKTLGSEGEGHYRGTMSGEDFSEYLRRVPGVLAFVGCRNAQIGATFAQHSCYYKVDESVLAKGSAVAAQYAIDFLAEPTRDELDGPLVKRVAEKNPELAATLRGARAAPLGAHHALRDAREARATAARELHDARRGK